MSDPNIYIRSLMICRITPQLVTILRRPFSSERPILLLFFQEVVNRNLHRFLLCNRDKLYYIVFFRKSSFIPRMPANLYQPAKIWNKLEKDVGLNLDLDEVALS